MRPRPMSMREFIELTKPQDWQLQPWQVEALAKIARAKLKPVK